MDLADRIVRKFLPAAASREEITVATIWLTQQVAPYIRHFDTMSQPPLNLKLDRGFLEQLARDLAQMTIAGLTARDSAAADRKPPTAVQACDVS